jgi:DNA-binding XRE family transcriptional regulator
MSVQIIQKDGRPEWAVIPYHEYEKLIQAAEAMEDVRAYDDALERIAAGEELIPAEVTFALLDGENPIRVWRMHRKLTQQELADRTNISKPYLSQLEGGKRSASIQVLQRIAAALNVTLDDLT